MATSASLSAITQILLFDCKLQKRTLAVLICINRFNNHNKKLTAWLICYLPYFLPIVLGLMHAVGYRLLARFYCPSVCLSVCNAVHCCAQGRCRELKVVPSCSYQALPIHFFRHFWEVRGKEFREFRDLCLNYASCSKTFPAVQDVVLLGHKSLHQKYAIPFLFTFCSLKHSLHLDVI